MKYIIFIFICILSLSAQELDSNKSNIGQDNNQSLVKVLQSSIQETYNDIYNEISTLNSYNALKDKLQRAKEFLIETSEHIYVNATIVEKDKSSLLQTKKSEEKYKDIIKKHSFKYKGQYKCKSKSSSDECKKEVKEEIKSFIKEEISKKYDINTSLLVLGNLKHRRVSKLRKTYYGGKVSATVVSINNPLLSKDNKQEKINEKYRYKKSPETYRYYAYDYNDVANTQLFIFKTSLNFKQTFKYKEYLNNRLYLKGGFGLGAYNKQHIYNVYLLGASYYAFSSEKYSVSIDMDLVSFRTLNSNGGSFIENYINLEYRPTKNYFIGFGLKLSGKDERDNIINILSIGTTR